MPTEASEWFIRRMSSAIELIDQNQHPKLKIPSPRYAQNSPIREVLKYINDVRGELGSLKRDHPEEEIRIARLNEKLQKATAIIRMM